MVVEDIFIGGLLLAATHCDQDDDDDDDDHDQYYSSNRHTHSYSDHIVTCRRRRCN